MSLARKAAVMLIRKVQESSERRDGVAPVESCVAAYPPTRLQQLRQRRPVLPQIVEQLSYIGIGRGEHGQ